MRAGWVATAFGIVCVIAAGVAVIAAGVVLVDCWGYPEGALGAGATVSVGVAALWVAHRWREQLHATKALDQYRDLIRSMHELTTRARLLAQQAGVNQAFRSMSPMVEDSVRTQAQHDEDTRHQYYVESIAKYRAEATLTKALDPEIASLLERVEVGIDRVEHDHWRCVFRGDPEDDISQLSSYSLAESADKFQGLEKSLAEGAHPLPKACRSLETQLVQRISAVVRLKRSIIRGARS